MVFGGDANGRFKAFDQETGAVLWAINLGSPVLGFPITYAVDGKEYVVASTSDESSRQVLTFSPACAHCVFADERESVWDGSQAPLRASQGR